MVATKTDKESLPETIIRLSAEAQKVDGWLIFTLKDGSTMATEEVVTIHPSRRSETINESAQERQRSLQFAPGFREEARGVTG